MYAWDLYTCNTPKKNKQNFSCSAIATTTCEHPWKLQSKSLDSIVLKKLFFDLFIHPFGRTVILHVWLIEISEGSVYSWITGIWFKILQLFLQMWRTTSFPASRHRGQTGKAGLCYLFIHVILFILFSSLKAFKNHFNPRQMFSNHGWILHHFSAVKLS